MAHLAQGSRGSKLPVFFNVDSVVGDYRFGRVENNPVDVLLVQFFLKAVPATDPEFRKEVGRIKVNGQIDTPTGNAIYLLQSLANKSNNLPGKVVDARVSPARGYHYGAGAQYTIVNLNVGVQRQHKNVWPRIDKIQQPVCPQELKQMLARDLIGQ